MSNGRVYSEPKSKFHLPILVSPDIRHGSELIAAQLTRNLEGASLERRSNPTATIVGTDSERDDLCLGLAEPGTVVRRADLLHDKDQEPDRSLVRDRN